MEKAEMKLPLCSAAEGEKRLRHPEKDCEVWMDSEKDAQSGVRFTAVHSQRSK